MSITREEKEFIQKIGETIVAIRKSKGIRQKELSDLLDMDDGSLRRIESGRTNPTSSTLYRIIVALDIEPKELFEFSLDK